MKNIDLFITEYSKNLRANYQNNPSEYGFPKQELDSVILRMSAAIRAGTFNKDSVSFKQTCKNLKVKYTYGAIFEFCNI